jgi:hypothetical protein
MTSETQLVRIYFPGVQSTDTINHLGRASYSNVTVQDIIDQGGPLYKETALDGSDLICMVTIYGSTTFTADFASIGTVTPVILPGDFFVGGRPSRPIAK